jgi:hypothetical protein
MNKKEQKAIAAMKQSSSSYACYTAALTQVSTGKPTAKILENDFGEVTYSRQAAGEYLGYCPGAFSPSDKLAFFVGCEGLQTRLTAWRIDDDYFKIMTYVSILATEEQEFTGTLNYILLDNLMADTVIEIRRYKQ